MNYLGKYLCDLEKYFFLSLFLLIILLSPSFTTFLCHLFCGFTVGQTLSGIAGSVTFCCVILLYIGTQVPQVPVTITQNYAIT